MKSNVNILIYNQPNYKNKIQSIHFILKTKIVKKIEKYQNLVFNELSS
jgi:hypothetical protein